MENSINETLNEEPKHGLDSKNPNLTTTLFAGSSWDPRGRGGAGELGRDCGGPLARRGGRAAVRRARERPLGGRPNWVCLVVPVFSVDQRLY